MGGGLAAAHASTERCNDVIAVSFFESCPEHETGIGSHHDFKKFGDDLWSVRVGRAYRALGRFEGDLLVWVWIGSHAEYDQVLR